MLLAFCLDLVMGDPRWLPHPVREMGRAISALEKGLRGLFPATPGGERAAGAVLALVLPVGSFWLGWAVLWLCGRLAPWLGLAAEVLLCSQCLAARELKKESMAVYRELERGDLSAARTAVARIVGRDTGSLTAEGVTKAAVETVAENTSDGEIAPLFWMAIGGAPLALAYKAVNTMDSMVGYRNERYRYFGTAAARLDDLVNWLPARMAALVMVALCPLAGLDAEGAFRVWRRDRKKHKSPNSAQTEAAMAGALGVQLAGDAWYFGELHHKPTLGDDLRPVRPADIKKADQLMYWTSGAFLLLAAWGRMAVSLL
ncbi:MAG: cobalamin biosynthesis protein CobD [Angelakisella sp.]|nr:cobalamin biosynthesis protein CobD [Angelakisella sp.]